MLFTPRFYYDDGSADGSGTHQEFISADEAKNLGFGSKEALFQFIFTQKEATKPDAEKQKEAELEKANFLKFSTEHELLNVDEYKSYEDLKAKADKDLVFEKFKNEFKEDNPEIEDEDLDEAAENAFQTEFKLNSNNEKSKARGEAKLKEEAEKLRSPFKTKYETAISRFGEFNNIAKTYPSFEKFVDDIITESIPEKLTVKINDDKTEVPVEVEIPKEQLDEVKKLFKTPKYFQNYVKGEKKDELKAAIAKKIAGYVKANNFDSVVNQAYRTAAGLYLKKGSTAGAENNFGIHQGSGGSVIPMNPQTVVDSNEKRASRRRNR